MKLRWICSSVVTLGLLGGAVSAAQAPESSSASVSAAPTEGTREPPKGVRLQHRDQSVLVEWGATAKTIKADLPETICSSMGSGESFCSPDLLEGWCVGFGSAYPDSQFFHLYDDHFYEYTVEYDVASRIEIASAFTAAMGQPVSEGQEQIQNGFGAKWDATTTVWRIGDVVVTVTTRAEKLDRGRITITNAALTPPKKEPEKAPF